MPSTESILVHHSGGKNLQHEAAGQAAAASDQSRSKLSGSPNDHQISASTGSHGNSAHSSGKKTQMVSGNHLLNFHYDPISRSQPRPRAPPLRRSERRKPYNKDLFLQANYKFVVLDSGNYAPEYIDPDKMLLWEDIICVKYLTPFQVQCPICLEDPLCPQITSCGHIFCFPCIMQYLMLGEDDCKSEYSKKCPLCFLMISSKDMYTIQIENVKQYHLGDVIEFLLLTRRKDSFLLFQKDKCQAANDKIQDTFSKFIFTSDVDLSFREAMSDLDSWLAKADSGLVDDLEKLPYVCAAIKQLDQRKKYWNERQVSNSFNHEAGEVLGANSSGSIRDKSARLGSSPPDWSQTTDTAELLDDTDGILSSSFDDHKNVPAHFNGFGDRKDRDSYSFYQVIYVLCSCFYSKIGHKIPYFYGNQLLLISSFF